MPRRKNEPIKTLGKDTDKLTIQKSLPLYSLWQSDLTLAEFKILDTFLSRIDSHNPERRSVIFQKGELEDLLGVKRIRTEDLDNRIAHLCTSVRVEDKNTARGFARVSLFAKAVAEPDDDGLWTVELKATSEAMEYIFNIEAIGYLRYKLKSIVNLQSRYSYVLFLYLEAHRNMGLRWDVSLAELKQVLACDKEEIYADFKYFNQRILKRCQAEIHEKTSCRFSYEPIRKGRRVASIRFTLEPMSEMPDPNQLMLESFEETEDRDLYEDALTPLGLTAEQVAELKELLLLVPEKKLPVLPNSMAAMSLRRCHYLRLKVATMQRIDSENGIKDKFAYLQKAIRKDAGLD